MEKIEVGKVMDTIMSSPGMNETVKVDFKISRKNVLILNSIIERGLSAKEEGTSGLLENIPKESLQEIKLFSGECLQKAGLTELNDKLRAFQK
jgi:hypothetical protein